MIDIIVANFYFFSLLLICVLLILNSNYNSLPKTMKHGNIMLYVIKY